MRSIIFASILKRNAISIALLVSLNLSCADRRQQALVDAAFKGDALTVKRLIDSGADVNRNGCVEGCLESVAQPPIIWTIEAPVNEDRKLAVMKELIAGGADVNVQGHDGVSALSRARGYKTLQTALLQARARE
jgi:hypothetical protein